MKALGYSRKYGGNMRNKCDYSEQRQECYIQLLQVAEVETLLLLLVKK